MLRAVSERDAYANLALPALLRERGITGRDAAFATELTYGACRTRGLLDAVIAAAAGRPPDNIDPVLLDLLRLGTYQLLRTRVDRTPRCPPPSSRRASNSIRRERVSSTACCAPSRRATKRPGSRSWPRRPTPIRSAHRFRARPSALDRPGVRRCARRRGRELDALLASDDERPPVHLAARPGVLTADELAAPVGGTVGRYSPYAVYLPGGDPGRLAAVRDGAALVQDEGSQLVARALTLAAVDGPDGGRWLDLCAGPGGKTALLAAIGAGSGRGSPPSSPPRGAPSWSSRTPAGCPSTCCGSTAATPGWSPGFDRVLVDAPCTGLGALRRRPEARWRRQPADVPGWRSCSANCWPRRSR